MMPIISDVSLVEVWRLVLETLLNESVKKSIGEWLLLFIYLFYWFPRQFFLVKKKKKISSNLIFSFADFFLAIMSKDSVVPCITISSTYVASPITVIIWSREFGAHYSYKLRDCISFGWSIIRLRSS